MGALGLLIEYSLVYSANIFSSSYQLALYVLSFLEPRDLLQAAQTCRYWRVLAEDNLLWREKCREESIDEAMVFENRIRRRHETNGNYVAKSPWKNLYLRQKAIEHNWRANPIRPPKVSKDIYLF